MVFQFEANWPLIICSVVIFLSSLDKVLVCVGAVWTEHYWKCQQHKNQKGENKVCDSPVGVHVNHGQTLKRRQGLKGQRLKVPVQTQVFRRLAGRRPLVAGGLLQVRRWLRRWWRRWVLVLLVWVRVRGGRGRSLAVAAAAAAGRVGVQHLQQEVVDQNHVLPLHGGQVVHALVAAQGGGRKRRWAVAEVY